MPEHQRERHRHVDQAEVVGQQPGQPGRAHDRDLRVPPHHQRVGVVPGMAPPPGGRVAHDHERGELVQGLGDPAGLERGAVPGLVPAGIRGRAVQDAVGTEERHRPPAVPDDPQGAAEAAEGQDQADPDDGVPDGRVVGAPHQLLHPLARHRAAEPRPAGQPGVHRRLVLRTRQAVPLQPLPADRCAHYVTLHWSAPTPCHRHLSQDACQDLVRQRVRTVQSASREPVYVPTFTRQVVPMVCPLPARKPLTASMCHRACSSQRNVIAAWHSPVAVRWLASGVPGVTPGSGVPDGPCPGAPRPARCDIVPVLCGTPPHSAGPPRAQNRYGTGAHPSMPPEVPSTSWSTSEPLNC